VSLSSANNLRRPRYPARALGRGLALVIALVALVPAPVFSCAACFGRSDSPMAKGMNAGMFALLCCILAVLATIGFFFFYILRRAARLAASLPSGAAVPSQPTRT